MNQILDYNPIRNDDGDNNYNNRNTGNKGNIIKFHTLSLPAQSMPGCQIACLFFPVSSF